MIKQKNIWSSNSNNRMNIMKMPQRNQTTMSKLCTHTIQTAWIYFLFFSIPKIFLLFLSPQISRSVLCVCVFLNFFSSSFLRISFLCSSFHGNSHGVGHAQMCWCWLQMRRRRIKRSKRVKPSQQEGKRDCIVPFHVSTSDTIESVTLHTMTSKSYQ